MDPALLNYIQSLQQTQPGNQPQLNSSTGIGMGQVAPYNPNRLAYGQPPAQPPQPQPQPMPQPVPQQPPQMSYGYNQPQPMQQQPAQVNNPFDAGIRRAIESARESLGMTGKQQDANIRNAMLTFAQNMGQQPRTKGFFENFGAASRAMIPALSAYGTGEEAALKGNNELANQILDRNYAEQARTAEEEQRRWQRQHAESQLAETRRYHNIIDSHYKQKAAGNTLTSSPLASAFVPFITKKELQDAGNKYDMIGGALAEASHINDEYNKYRKKYQNNAIDRMGAFGGIGNMPKDLIGRLSNNKKLQQERAEWDTLTSMVKKFTAELEQQLKGGQLTLGMVNYFDKYKMYPDLTTDNPTTFELKWKALQDSLQKGFDTADLSLKHRVHLNPSQLGKAKEMIGIQPTPQVGAAEQQTAPAIALTPVQTGMDMQLNPLDTQPVEGVAGAAVGASPAISGPPGLVIMVNPATGEELSVPADDVPHWEHYNWVKNQ